jgi:hypothetical protein
LWSVSGKGYALFIAIGMPRANSPAANLSLIKISFENRVLQTRWHPTIAENFDVMFHFMFQYPTFMKHCNI